MISISCCQCAASGATPSSRIVPPDKRKISGPVRKPYPARGLEIKRLWKRVARSIGQTRTEIRQYAEDHPVFRETARKMVAAWEMGLVTLLKKE